MFENKHDIKLIATDMDGTLLNSEGKLPKDFFKVVEELHKNGVIFVAASGRQYFNISHIFDPVIDKMLIVADNGGVTFDQNMLIGSIPIETDWHQYTEAIEKIPFAYPVLCCIDKCYIENLNMEFLRNVTKYYRRIEIVPDFRYINKEVIKVAAFNAQNAERYVYPYLEKFKDEVQVKVSADTWVDINNLQCNKGAAIRNLQEQFNISKDQTMVFGDFLNDLEMMQEAKYSFAMENAHPQLKQYANYEAPSNNEDGVLKVIEEYFNINVDEL